MHFKSLIPISPSVNQFIGVQLAAMQMLFAESNVAVLPGTTEDLSGNPTLQPLQNLNVGQCRRDQPTAAHNALFANRNGVANTDLVVYIVATLIGVDSSGNPVTNLLGCATHPAGQPGVAVILPSLINSAPWLVAHEVGHVLGLNHVCETNQPPAVPCAAGHSDSLMFPTVAWTNVPPNLSAGESSAMVTSNLTRPC